MNKIVETELGKIEGYSEKGIDIFKGIPYAEPPIGEFRFAPPREKESWEGVLDATQYGPRAIQGYTQLENFFPLKGIDSEADCLTLNIWTPSCDSEKRPVMMWIHGGAYIFGTGSNPIYDGSILAKRGNIVIVTINYRLGAFGFLSLPGAAPNAGILDQVEALKWINKNIEDFGGDPSNVTIFGESAGGGSVCALLAMPSTKGLVHHAISQSGALVTAKPNKKMPGLLMQELGIENGDINSLRRVSAEKLIEAQNAILARAAKESTFGALAFRPSVDGDSLPVPPLEPLLNGAGKDVDLLLGCNQHETTIFFYFQYQSNKVEIEKLRKEISRFFTGVGVNDERASNYVKTYENIRNISFSEEPLEILNVIVTDLAFRIPGIRFAETHSTQNRNTYMYLFTWPSPAFKGVLGSCHMVELPFVFGNLDVPRAAFFFGSGPAAETLSQRMMDSWIAFAHTGNPNCESIPEWKPYNTKTRATMIIGEEFKSENAPFDKERAVWDKFPIFKI